MIIRHNMTAWNANRQSKVNTGKAKKISEKLASGYKINRAADDAAGLSISEKMRKQIRGLDQAADNIQEGIGYVQVADGALEEVQEILQRINELSVKSANGTNSDRDRYYIDEEVQDLKIELTRIFETTEFNDEKIWFDNTEILVGVGTVNVQAVTTNDSSLWKDVTNDNCEVVAYNGYTLHADDTGVNVTWKGHDGNEYKTKTVDWDTLKSNNYSFEMSDYFGEVTADNKLYDTSGNPVFTRKISFSPRKGATQADIIACVDGATISSSKDSDMDMRFEDGKNTYSGVSVYSSDLEFNAAYVSNQKADDSNTSTTPFTFDAATDTFLEAADSNGTILTAGNQNGNLISIPAATKNLSSTISDAELEAAKKCEEGWTFSFYMEGLGKVTAKSSSLTYYSNDAGYYREDDKNLWWYEIKNSNGGYTKYAEGYSASATLSGVMSALTGDRNSATPGLLTADKGGCADTGGYINLSFSLNADNAFSSGSVSGQKSVGSFTLRINVSSSDTEKSVLKRISDALNENTLLDAYTSNGSRTYGEHYFSKPYLKQHYIQETVYHTAKREKVFLDVHGGAGAKSEDQLSIVYDVLSLKKLGINETNVLTEESALKAIDQIDEALHKVNEQRSTFGAYQNRLERAYNIDNSTSENLQAAESQIRDTDMAKTMVEYSNQNILLQSVQSMMAQANSSSQGIMQLLQS